jgi:hypothetical protein
MEETVVGRLGLKITAEFLRGSNAAESLMEWAHAEHGAAKLSGHATAVALVGHYHNLGWPLSRVAETSLADLAVCVRAASPANKVAAVASPVEAKARWRCDNEMFDSVAEFISWIDATIDALNSADVAYACTVWSLAWDQAVANAWSLGLPNSIKGLGDSLPAYMWAPDSTAAKSLRDELRTRLLALRQRLTGRTGDSIGEIGVNEDDERRTRKLAVRAIDILMDKADAIAKRRANNGQLTVPGDDPVGLVIGDAQRPASAADLLDPRILREEELAIDVGDINPQPEQSQAIPTDKRTRIMSKSEAARKLGFKGRNPVQWITRRINGSKIHAPIGSGQQWQFHIDDFPPIISDSIHPKV